MIIFLYLFTIFKKQFSIRDLIFVFLNRAPYCVLQICHSRNFFAHKIICCINFNFQINIEISRIKTNNGVGAAKLDNNFLDVLNNHDLVTHAVFSSSGHVVLAWCCSEKEVPHAQRSVIQSSHPVFFIYIYIQLSLAFFSQANF